MPVKYRVWVRRVEMRWSDISTALNNFVCHAQRAAPPPMTTQLKLNVATLPYLSLNHFAALLNHQRLTHKADRESTCAGSMTQDLHYHVGRLVC